MRAFNREDLERHAFHIRRRIIHTIAANGEGHAGGALSIADCMSVVAFAACSEEKDPILRDKIILSAGHKCLALYSMLAERGDLQEDVFSTYNQLGTVLPGHPDATKISEIDFSTGSLGHGLPVGCGFALTAKRLGLGYHTFVMMGDGEQGEGSNWEAAAFAAHNHLNNLIAILDENGLQINGTTAEVCRPTEYTDRYQAFGWYVQCVDGHDVGAIYDALANAMQKSEKPSLIVAKTVKGKGVSFMENKAKYHHWNPDIEEGQKAVAEFDEYGKVKGWL